MSALTALIGGALLLGESGGLAVAANPAVQAVAAQAASPWMSAQRAAIRLLAGDRQADGAYRAALEIRLDPGFKTYWRSPGDSGLPPQFDWSGSTNVADVAIAWPYPARMADPVGVSNVYYDNVALPLIVRPQRPEAPVTLALKLDFGVCDTICIPAHAEASLALPPEGTGLHARTIAAALAKVPVARELGAPDDLAVLSAVPVKVAGKPMLKVAIRAPEPQTAEVFVEGPDPWLFGTPGPADPAQDSTTPGLAIRMVPVADAPGADTSSTALAGTVPLRLTLVAQGRAIETSIVIDAAALRP